MSIKNAILLNMLAAKRRKNSQSNNRDNSYDDGYTDYDDMDRDDE